MTLTLCVKVTVSTLELTCSLPAWPETMMRHLLGDHKGLIWKFSASEIDIKVHYDKNITA